MPDKIPFTYGEFYDLPRMIELQFEGEWFFLRSEFDEEKDDYTDYYNAYRLPLHSDAIRAKPFYWTDLGNEAHLERIPTAEIGLDETRRQSVDARVFQQWRLARVK